MSVVALLSFAAVSSSDRALGAAAARYATATASARTMALTGHASHQDAAEAEAAATEATRREQRWAALEDALGVYGVELRPDNWLSEQWVRLGDTPTRVASGQVSNPTGAAEVAR